MSRSGIDTPPPPIPTFLCLFLLVLFRTFPYSFCLDLPPPPPSSHVIIFSYTLLLLLLLLIFVPHLSASHFSPFPSPFPHYTPPLISISFSSFFPFLFISIPLNLPFPFLFSFICSHLLISLSFSHPPFLFPSSYLSHISFFLSTPFPFFPHFFLSPSPPSTHSLPYFLFLHSSLSTPFFFFSFPPIFSPSPSPSILSLFP